MATTSKRAPARPARSKPEVEREFADIRKETAARDTGGAKSIETGKQREAEVRQAVDGISVDAVVGKISGLGIEISRALSDISEKLIQEVERLAAVRDAVELERREVERIHKIDIATTALDQLVEQHEEMKQHLEAEITSHREVWEEGIEAAERERKEQEDALKKQRQREIDDYEYKKTLERKRAQDKHDEEVRLVEKKNQEKQESLEKTWQQREAALKEREVELARLKKEAEQFPLRLKEETDLAVAQATRESGGRFEQQIAMLKKDAETEKRVSDLQISTLEEVIARQNSQIAEMQKQLIEAKQQVQDIAVKAIEGASGSKALSHVNQIAMEQAKQRPSQG